MPDSSPRHLSAGEGEIKHCSLLGDPREKLGEDVIRWLQARRRMRRRKVSRWENVVERRLKQNRPSKQISLHAGLISFIEIASKQELFASHGRRQHCSPINPRSVVSPSSKPVLHGDRFNEPGPVGRADCLFGAPERRPGRTTTQRFASGENQRFSGAPGNWISKAPAVPTRIRGPKGVISAWMGRGRQRTRPQVSGEPCARGWRRVMDRHSAIRTKLLEAAKAGVMVCGWGGKGKGSAKHDG